MTTTGVDDGAPPGGLFRALLRHWRQERSLSQLDLSLAAEVSARHISFLETGRSSPSVEMVVQLAETLDIPLRARNEMLRAAGFEARYPEPDVLQVVAGPLGPVLDAILTGAEPFPLFVLDETYDLVAFNRGAEHLVGLAGVELATGINLVRLLFEPAIRHRITNWDQLAGHILRRLQRQRIIAPTQVGCGELLEELLSQPDIPESWRRPRPDQGGDPAVPLEVEQGEVRLRFLLTVTRFSAPSNITVEGLQIEQYLPLDDDTRRYFEAVAET